MNFSPSQRLEVLFLAHDAQRQIAPSRAFEQMKEEARRAEGLSLAKLDDESWEGFRRKFEEYNDSRAEQLQKMRTENEELRQTIKAQRDAMALGVEKDSEFKKSYYFTPTKEKNWNSLSYTQLGSGGRTMGKSPSAPALGRFGRNNINRIGVGIRRKGGTPPGVLGCLVDDVVRDDRFTAVNGYRSAVLSHKKQKGILGGGFPIDDDRQQQQQQPDSGFFSPIVRRQQPQRGMVASQSTPALLGWQQPNQQQQELQFVHTRVSSRDSTPPAEMRPTYLNASAQRSEELIPIKGPAFTAKFGHHDPVPRKRKNLGLDFSGGMNFISREQAAYIT